MTGTCGRATPFVRLLLALPLALPVPAVLAVTGTDPIRTIAGSGANGNTGDGGPAVAAAMVPNRLAIDTQGNVYVVDSTHHVVRRVSPLGVVTRVAGTGAPGSAGDGGPATQATLDTPIDAAVDAAGNLYIAERNGHLVRRVDAATGIISRFAGGGTGPGNGDGGAPTAAVLRSPVGLAIRGAELYIAEFDTARVRRVKDGVITTFAGTGNSVAGGAGIGGPATQASIGAPFSVAAGGLDVYIGDLTSQRIWRVGADGTIHPHAGGGTSTAEGAPALQARFGIVTSIAIDGAMNLYVADQASQTIHRIDAFTSQRTTVAGVGVRGFGGDGGPAASAAINDPFGVAHDVGSNLYIADAGNFRVRKVSGALASDLSIRKQALSRSVTQGRMAQFEITVRNAGPFPAGRVVLVEEPGNAAVGALSAGAGAACTTAPPECRFGPVGVGGTVTVQVSVAPMVPGRYCNGARVYAPVQDDPNSADNTAAPSCLTVVRPFGAGEFVALARDTLSLAPRSLVVSGAVGATTMGPGPGDEVILAGPMGLGPGSFVLGHTVQLVGQRVAQVFTEELRTSSGGRADAVSLPGSFPSLEFPSLPAMQPGTMDVPVAAGQTRFLVPGAYRNVTVQPGGTLVLRGFEDARLRIGEPDYRGYDFALLDVKDNGKLLVSEPALPSQRWRLGVAIRIAQQMRAGRAAVIGPQRPDGALRGQHVILYVAGADEIMPEGEGAAVFAHDSRIRANALVPNGTIVFARGAHGTGAFLGRRIRGDAGVKLTLESAFR